MHQLTAPRLNKDIHALLSGLLENSASTKSFFSSAFFHWDWTQFTDTRPITHALMLLSSQLEAISILLTIVVLYVSLLYMTALIFLVID